MAQSATDGNQVDVAALLRETTSALEHFDTAALLKLLERAEQLDDAPPSVEILKAAQPQQRALSELLAATDRNLRMLRRLRGESSDGEKLTWVR